MRVQIRLACFIIRHSVFRKKKLLFAKHKLFKQKIFYSLKFSSLFLPGLIKNIRLFTRSSAADSRIKVHNNNNHKILVKQSYILLIWFAYISKNYEPSTTLSEDLVIPGFFIYPKKIIKFTLMKAPMAHKTFSQEQFCFANYLFSISFKSKYNLSILKNKKNVVFFLKYISTMHLFCGTNMLFLKSYRFFFSLSDSKFFSYFDYISYYRLYIEPFVGKILKNKKRGMDTREIKQPNQAQN